jgi:hypothetical protein
MPSRSRKVSTRRRAGSSRRSTARGCSKDNRKLKLISIKKSPKPDKKLVATFCTEKGRTKEVHFGAKGYSDFTIHKDEERKRRYTLRHKSRENFKDPTSRGSLALYVLWNKTSLRASIADYKRRFKL